jgi:hypothetical protein
MRTTPHSFYKHFVLPNFRDYVQRPDDIRLGFNAAVPAFQLADIMWSFYEREDPAVINAWPSPKAFLSHLTHREPYFRTVRSVANAYKHLYFEPKKASFYEITSPGDVFVVETKDIELLSESYDERALVIVNRKDGTQVVLKTALEAVVLRLWPSVMPETS